jgi:hypothetical protein
VNDGAVEAERDQRGISGIKRTGLTPNQTIESLKEDTEWAKQQTK